MTPTDEQRKAAIEWLKGVLRDTYDCAEPCDKDKAHIAALTAPVPVDVGMRELLYKLPTHDICVGSEVNRYVRFDALETLIHAATKQSVPQEVVDALEQLRKEQIIKMQKSETPEDYLKFDSRVWGLSKALAIISQK